MIAFCIFIAFLVTSSSVNCSCLWGVKGNDSLSVVNEILVSGTNSDDATANFQLAETTVLEKGSELGHEILEILENFVNLRELDQQLKTRSENTCRAADYRIMKEMHQSMKRCSRKDPYTKPQSRRRLNSIVIKTTNDYAEYCFVRLEQEGLTLMLDFDYGRAKSLGQLGKPFLENNSFFHKFNKFDNLIRAVDNIHAKRLSNTSSGGRLRWLSVFRLLYKRTYDSHAIRVPDPRTGKQNITLERVRKLYDELITSNCNYFASNHKFLDYFARAMQFASSARLTNDIAPSHHGSTMLMECVPGYMVCQGLKNVDQDKVIRNLHNSISTLESIYLAGQSSSDN